MTDAQFVIMYFIIMPMVIVFALEYIFEYLDEVKRLKKENARYRKAYRTLLEKIEKQEYIKRELPTAIGNSKRIFR